MMTQQLKKYRDNGAIGALLDEYEKAVIELQLVINDITPTELTTIVDPDTDDSDCRSIQTILNHVIGAGYGYVKSIRNWLGEDNKWQKQTSLETVQAYQTELKNMFAYNEQFFIDYPNIEIEEYNAEKKILVSWGQLYDIEQLFEHAILHVLRHRRQIERFLIKLR